MSGQHNGLIQRAAQGEEGRDGLRPGDRPAAASPRALFGRPCAPAWYVLLVAPQCEPAVTSLLLRLGAQDAWYPTEVAWRQRPHRAGKVRYLRRVAPGYVFVRVTRQPAWHLFREALLGMVRGVVGHDGLPLPIPESVLAEMRQVPARIESLRRQAEAERLAREAAELAAWHIVAPCRAELRRGPFAGIVVEVETIHAGIARAILRLQGGPVPMEVGIAALRRVG